jgi:hypothetical protein
MGGITSSHRCTTGLRLRHFYDRLRRDNHIVVLSGSIARQWQWPGTLLPFHTVQWDPERPFHCSVDGTDFTIATFFRASDGGWVVGKTREMIERLATIVLELQPRRIVELGIARGGSTAFLATLAKPERLIAIERDAGPVPGLDAFPCIQVCYGTDQADRATIQRVVGDEALDLVIDDASHLLDLSRASFNILFPLLRPGGLYIIEDWAWAHADYDVEGADKLTSSFPPGEPALTRLVVEILMTCGSLNGVVSNLYVTPGAVEVVRGPAPLDENFDIGRSFRTVKPTGLRHRLAQLLPHRSRKGDSSIAE